jgi:hypothetical protein
MSDPLVDARQGNDSGCRVRLESVADPLMGQALEAEQILKREPDRFDSPGLESTYMARTPDFVGFPELARPRYCQAILSQVRSEHGVAPAARRFGIDPSNRTGPEWRAGEPPLRFGAHQHAIWTAIDISPNRRAERRPEVPCLPPQPTTRGQGGL